MKTKLILKSVISTCALVLIMTFNASAFTAVTSGLWSSAATWGGVAPGGTVTGQDIVIPSGLTITFDTDVTFSGLANSFTVNGTLTSSTMNTLTMTQGSFSGSGMVNLHKVIFNNLLATMPFTGTINVDEFENNGATISLASIMNIADTLYLNSGSIVLNAGSNLTTMMNSTVKVNNGTMTVSGGIFNSSNNYSALYIGNNKTSGVEINTTTLKNLYVQLSNNIQTLILAGNTTVNGDLHNLTGRLDFSGHSLTLKGDYINPGTGAVLSGSTSSNLTVQGTTPPAQGLIFASGAALNNFSIDYSGAGNLKLNSALDIAGTMELLDGTLSLESGSTLSMLTGTTIRVKNGAVVLNTGTLNTGSNYNLEYIGTPSINTGIEATGTGLTNLTISTPFMGDIVILSNDVYLNGNLTMTKGRLNLNNNKLTVNGLLTQSLNSEFVGTAGSDLELNLSTADDTLYFYPSYQDLGTLKLNISGNIVLGTDLTIHNQLDLTSGKLVTDDYILSIASTGVITNYSDVNYVVTSDPAGKLQMYVNSSGPYVTFPVGTMTDYSPAYLQQTASGTSGNFMVNTMDGVYTNGTVGFNSATTESVVNRTWIIDEETGVTVSSNIKLGWKTSSEVNGFNRSNCYISHYTGAWDTHATGAATTGAFSTYEISRTSLSTLSPFSVADNNAVLEVNEVAQQQEGITIYPNPSRDFVYIENANFVDDFKYEVVDVTGQVLMTISIANKGNRHMFDVTKLNHGYYFIRATNLDNKEITTKRFIKG